MIHIHLDNLPLGQLVVLLVGPLVGPLVDLDRCQHKLLDLFQSSSLVALDRLLELLDSILRVGIVELSVLLRLVLEGDQLTAVRVVVAGRRVILPVRHVAHQLTLILTVLNLFQLQATGKLAALLLALHLKFPPTLRFQIKNL